MNQGLKKLIALVLTLVIGVVCIVMGCINLKHDKEFPKTTAVVSRIDVLSGINPGDEDYDANVYVKYTVNGKEYEEILQGGKNYSEGDTLEVSYNPEKPESVAEAGKSGPIIAIAIGAVLTLAGAVMCVSTIIKGR